MALARRGARPRGGAARPAHPLPRAPRRRPRLQAGALERIGLFRREPTVAAAAAAQPGPSPAAGPPLDPARLAARSTGCSGSPRHPSRHPRRSARTVTIAQRAELIRAALRGADAVVLQELLRGVRDRVVVAVTFLAMLELMKRREIVVEQAEPWGPIVARATTPEERPPAASPADEAADRRDRWSRSRDRATTRPGPTRPARRRRRADDAGAAPPPGELTEAALEALLFVAERPLSRREIGTLAGVDRETVDARLGDLEVSLAATGDPAGPVRRPGRAGDRSGGRRADRAVRRRGRVRLSPAALETLAIVAYRQPVTKGGVERIRGVDSDYTIRALLHRRLIVELGRSDDARAGRTCTAPASSSSSGSG